MARRSSSAGHRTLGRLGIETVFQTLALAPSLDIATNMYMGRELRRHDALGKYLRILDHAAMRRESKRALQSLGIGTIQNITQAVETLSGGQRQAVAVARARRLRQQGHHPRRADGRARRPRDRARS